MKTVTFCGWTTTPLKDLLVQIPVSRGFSPLRVNVCSQERRARCEAEKKCVGRQPHGYLEERSAVGAPGFGPPTAKMRRRLRVKLQRAFGRCRQIQLVATVVEPE